MKLVTFNGGNEDRVGVLLGEKTVLDIARACGEAASADTARLKSLAGDMLGVIRGGSRVCEALGKLMDNPPESAMVDLSDVTVRAPIPRPERNVFCVGRNYLAHVREGDRTRNQETTLPEWPQFFTKPPQAVIGPEETIPSYQGFTKCLDYEVELAIVIGTEGRDIAEGDAMAHVFGATIGNDITARDVQRRHVQWFKGKGLDRSCPLGPWIVTRDELDPTDLELSLRVNGELRQQNRTSNMIFPIPTIISQLSAGMTLYPGDIILTGTPEGVGYAMDPPRCLLPSDDVVATIEGIGFLRNRVA